MINENYIYAFPENEYIDLLNSPSKMLLMKDYYIDKYKSTDAYYIALKESLDHYISMRLKKDSNFKNTNEFSTYIKYLAEVTKENTNNIGLKTFHLEPSTNIVFNYLDEKTINKYFPNIDKMISKNKKTLDNIFYKIKNNQLLTNNEMNLAAKYLECKKEKNYRYDTFIDYVFNNLKRIGPSTEVLSAIASYLPYTFEPENIGRCIFAKYDNLLPINVAHCNRNYDYTCYNVDYFNSIRLDSFEAAKSSRSLDSNDIVLLLFIVYHELTHQKQQNDVKMNKFAGAAMDITNAINSVFQGSYACNHDSSEIEIEADELGWKYAAKFVEKYISKDLAKECLKNSEAVSCRRVFAKKQVPDSGKLMTNIEYDMKLLSEAVKKDPSIRNKFPNISKIITQEGAFYASALFKENLVTYPSGWEFCNYVFNNIPIKFFTDKIESKEYSDKEILTLINNLFEVPHKNTDTIKKLKEVDLTTYKNTDSKTYVDKEEIYNDQFCNCAQQFIKFNKIIKYAYLNYPNTINKEIMNAYNKVFIKEYYYEMLHTISEPDTYRINKIMNCYDNLDSNLLKALSTKTREYLKDKPSRDLQYMFAEPSTKTDTQKRR